MNVTMTLDANSDAALLKFRQDVANGLARIVHEVGEEAKQLAIRGANQGIYDTPEQAYRRTEEYRDSIDAVVAAQGSTGLIEVFATADYASYLEYGGKVLSQRAAESLAAILGPGNRTLYLGRTGELWVRPNPAITRAAVFAGLRYQQRVGELLAGQIRTGTAVPQAAD